VQAVYQRPAECQVHYCWGRSTLGRPVDGERGHRLGGRQRVVHSFICFFMIFDFIWFS
jgi:hypothetical protein